MEKNKTSSHSVISVTMGVLSILIPLVGLIFGLFGFVMSKKALREIGKTSEFDRRLATLGLICSSVGTVVQLLAVMGLIAYYTV